MMTGDTNDYSVCTTWQMIKADYYLVDVFRARLQYPDLRRKVASLAAKHGAETILIEDAGPGMALLQDLWRDLPRGHGHALSVRNRREAKRIAWWRSRPRLKQDTSICPREADWLDTFLLELLAFPNGRHDDQVDSVSQFLKWAALRQFRDSNMLIGAARQGVCRWS